METPLEKTRSRIQSLSPFWRGVTRFLIFLLLLPPIAVAIDLLVTGNNTHDSVGDFLWMIPAAVLYAALMHYFEAGWFSPG